MYAPVLECFDLVSTRVRVPTIAVFVRAFHVIGDILGIERDFERPRVVETDLDTRAIRAGYEVALSRFGIEWVWAAWAFEIVDGVTDGSLRWIRIHVETAVALLERQQGNTLG